MEKRLLLDLASRIEDKVGQSEKIQYRFLDASFIEIDISGKKVRIRESTVETAPRVFQNIYRISIIDSDGMLIDTEDYLGEASNCPDTEPGMAIGKNECDNIFGSIFKKCKELSYRTSEIVEEMFRDME